MRTCRKGTDDTLTAFRRKPDPSGVSFYGLPLFPGDVARSYELIESLFEKFTDAYLDMIAKRAAAPVTPDDVAHPGVHAQELAFGSALQRPVCQRAGAF